MNVLKRIAMSPPHSPGNAAHRTFANDDRDGRAWTLWLGAPGAPISLP
jgi:hypothetical protein